MERRETTETLIEKAASGDRIAFQRLVLFYWERLERRLSMKIPISMQGRISGEDVLQEALFDAARAITSFQPCGAAAFYRWLLRIADHRLRDAIKAQRAVKRGGGFVQRHVDRAAETSTVDDLINLLAGPRATPSGMVARDEALAALHVGLASLKENHRRTIQLRYIQGMPVAEVANIMNVTRAAVHNLCYRGIRELRSVMGESSDFLSRP